MIITKVRRGGGRRHVITEGHKEGSEGPSTVLFLDQDDIHRICMLFGNEHSFHVFLCFSKILVWICYKKKIQGINLRFLLQFKGEKPTQSPG